ncbi:MAG TPA: DegV family protein [Clostridiales bacterium]|nr:MAG: fatty acid-binding protein DegV [Clostridiales bacterium GWD2_32_19]HCC06964.1 DegV family protein [Clostridiales bacterium]
MNSKIIADSCCDLSKQMQEDINVDLIPFKILVDDVTYVDDDNLNPMDLLKAMKSTPSVPKSSCPSPDDFYNSFINSVSNSIFIVTISSFLSGTYNSALVAKNMFLETNKDKFIHIFDSLSAASGEVLVALKINDCIEKELPNDDIVSTVAAFIDEMKTFFILDSLDNLIKNGRISKLKGFIANILNIVPIMKAVKGEIDMHEKSRGSKKAFNRLVEIIGEHGSDFKDKILSISHCNAKEKAEWLKESVSKAYNFKDIIILETKGLSTMYAYDGGIIIAF